jgi:hypothetical protein
LAEVRLLRLCNAAEDSGVAGLLFDSAEIVSRCQDELKPARAGGDADDVEEDESFIGIDGEGLLCAEDGDATADVSGEWLDVDQRHELGFAPAGQSGQSFKAEVGVGGNDSEERLRVSASE